MIKHDSIAARVRALAAMIHQDYKGRRPVLVCILKGACPFYQHLLDALMDLRQGFLTEFFRVSSYEGTSSSGQVKFSGGFSAEDLEGRDVILVEDIIDTGTTISQLIPLLKEQCNSIKSVEICSLLSKRLEEPAKVEAKYVGFSIPNHFIIGYGLDYNELYRDLKDIWVISTTGIQFDSKTL
jgi:hypoxanthine phosphoribosyltransferase